MNPHYKQALIKRFVTLLLASAFIQVALTGFSDHNNAVPAYKLIVFEGSDWCPNCIRLEKKVLNDVKFVSFLKEKQIELEKIDFPQRKKLSKEKRSYNASVAEKYRFDGSFPTLVLANISTKKHRKIDTAHLTVEEMIEKIAQKLELLQ